MATFRLKTGQTVILDAEDLERVIRLKWHVGSEGYAKHSFRHNRKVCSLYLHHFILGRCDKTDHNGNKLDNRKQNLRPATASQNAGNSCKQPGISRFKGVYWDKKFNLWRAQIGPKRTKLVRFIDEAEAAAAYDSAARSRWGDYAKVNFS
jgi:hypothetical protein